MCLSFGRGNAFIDEGSKGNILHNNKQERCYWFRFMKEKLVLLLYHTWIMRQQAPRHRHVASQPSFIGAHRERKRHSVSLKLFCVFLSVRVAILCLFVLVFCIFVVVSCLLVIVAYPFVFCVCLLLFYITVVTVYLFVVIICPFVAGLCLSVVVLCYCPM